MVKEVVKEFLDDDSPRSAAALAYYAIFSLPPLLVLILMVTGLFVDPQDVQVTIQQQARGMLGTEAARAIETMIGNASRPGGGGLRATLLSLGALAFGATGAFGQLQTALNTAWEVEPDPDQGGVKSFVLKRIFSFGMILVVAFLMLISLVLSAALTALGESAASVLPVPAVGARLIDVAVSLFFVTVLFAAMFKILPDAVIVWRDVWVGALATGILFVAGKFLIGLYIGRSDPGSVFGAAGSLAVILIWVYYSGIVVLFGAEFTQVWARRHGHGIRPEPGAVRVVESRQRVEREAA